MTRQTGKPGRLAAFAIALLMACAVVTPARGADPESLHPARHGTADRWALNSAGHWIVDPQGSVVIMHGENLVVKGPPWVATGRGFNNADAAFLADNGFDSVRLGFMWAGIEPKPGVFDDAVLRRIAAEIRMLHAHGIGVLLDAHQDLFNPKYQGDGFPDWAINDSGLPNPPLGFPNNYLANPAEQQSWNSFWNNVPAPGDTVGVQTRYVQMWHHVVAYLSHLPGIIGYDPINEPMPGTLAATCLAAGGCAAFEAGRLSAFYRSITHTIRTVDPWRLIFFEPVPTFAFGATSSSVNNGSDPRSVFNFHDYCLTSQTAAGDDGTALDCPILDQQVFNNADAAAKHTGDPEFMSEFGGNTSTKELGYDLSDADQHMVGWMDWEYCGCNEPDASTSPSVGSLINDQRKPPAGANLNTKLLHALVRPYPQAIAGTPIAWKYDTSSRIFTFTYSTVPAGHRLAVSARTLVFVPRLVYPAGYTVRVTGGRARSRTNAQLLKIANRRGAETVTVKVVPRRGHSA
jgi:endoglycosylceramidase